MGSGKGSPEGWVAVVKPGRVMFELGGVPEAAGPRGDAPRWPQAAREDEIRDGERTTPDMTAAIELRDMHDGAELIEHLQTARRELFGLRFQHATGELENTAGLRLAKREVARALTVIRERGWN